MKNSTNIIGILFPIFLLLSINLNSQVCNTVYLTNQTDVNNFNCTEIYGDLIIDDGNTGLITSLWTLPALEYVSGDVIIQNCPGLTSLEGADFIVSIEGNLSIINNFNLAEFSLYDWYLEYIGGDLVIDSNPSLQKVPLGNLSSIGGELSINFNAGGLDLYLYRLSTLGGQLFISINNINYMDLNNLTTINGAMVIAENTVDFDSDEMDFTKLETVIGGIQINDNSGIHTLNGFNNLSSIGEGLFISNNSFLQNINGFNNLDDIHSIISINGNFELQTIDGFTSITEINNALLIKDNGALTSLDGFQNLSIINGALEIKNNNSFSKSSGGFFTPLDGFNNLKTITFLLDISENGIFNEIRGFQKLEFIENVFIEANAGLSTINGFNAVKTINQNLHVSENTDLHTIEGFNALEYVGTDLAIFLNNALTSISEFSSLTTIGQEYYFANNDLMSTLLGPQQLQNVGTTLTISFNDLLETVLGFDALESAQFMSINFNPVLTEVVGFPNFQSLEQDLQLTNNSQLQACCWIENIYSAIDAGEAHIADNAPGCNSLAEIGGAAPVISCPGTLSYETSSSSCISSFLLADPLVEDECSVLSYTTSLVDPNGNIIYEDLGAEPGESFIYDLGVGTSEISYKAADHFGNESNCSINIIVEDTTSPVWSGSSISLNLNGTCGVDDPTAIFAANIPVAIDNCGVDQIDHIASAVSGNCGGEITYTRVYTAKDIYGNESLPFTVNVSLQDNEAPILSGVVTDITINCDDLYPAEPQVTAYDNCAGDLSYEIIKSFNSVPGNCSLGNFAEINTTTWTVSDGCGNTNELSWTVQVNNNFNIDLGEDVVICNQNSYTITAPLGSEYLWSDNSNSQSITVSNSDIYSVTVTSTNGCCSTDEINISFFEAPTLTAQGGTIDCSGSSINLSSSTNAFNPAYLWTGPGGFSSTQANPTVSQTGTYLLQVTDANGCTNTTETQVIPDTSVPDLISAGGTISCNNPSVNISAISYEATSFSWTGPNGFNSDQASVEVSTSGMYTITVQSSNGCTNSTSVLVDEDLNPPSISAEAETITCTNTSANVSSSGSDDIVSYSWTGPNGFNSDQESLDVESAGSYSLIVTAENGCTAMTSVEVFTNTTLPSVELSANELNCANSITTLNAVTNSTTVSYAWSGPNGFSAGSSNPRTSVPGLYTVTITELNGCTASSSFVVVLDNQEPAITATATAINCQNINSTLEGTSNDANSTFGWSGPNGFNSTQAIAETNISGTYQLLVTASNGCTALEMITVTLDTLSPNLTINQGPFNCSDQSTTLTAETANGNSISWSGPNGFESNDATISISTNGEYFVTIENPTNGCTTTNSNVVDQDFNLPIVSASGGTITCNTNSITLTGNSNLSNATYAWTGPNDFSSSVQNPIVNEQGTYTLTVNNPANDCSVMTQAIVTEDLSPPILFAFADTLSCSVTSVDIIIDTYDEISTNNWTGPNGFSANTLNISVTDPGLYILNATGSNGCNSILEVSISSNQDAPNVQTSVSGNLNCINDTVELTASSNSSTVSFSWAGPNGFSSTLANPETSEPGEYTLTAMETNGCSSASTITVILDNQSPEVTVNNSNLNCANENATLTASTNDPNASFLWSGPNGFAATTHETSNNEVGNYTVVVTASNGCTTTATINVTEDSNPPELSITAETLDCSNTVANLTAQTEGNIESYQWSGPNGFSSTNANTNTIVPGQYQLTVTGINGCSNIQSVEVTQDIEVPELIVNATQIDCNNERATLSAESYSNLSNYLWQGPNGFSATGSEVSASEAGTYQVIITGTNGCTNMETIQVVENIIQPQISLIIDSLTCIQPTAELSASSNDPTVMFEWSGPNGYNATGSNVTSSSPGLYEVVATGSNGCQSQSTFEVISNQEGPQIATSASLIDCNNNAASLNVSSPDSGISYRWSGPNSFSSNAAATSTAIAGSYTVVATGSNGCTSESTVLVESNLEAPDLSLSFGSIDCPTSSIALVANYNSNFSIRWSGPNNFNSTDAVVSASIIGQYQATVTNNLNGCSTTQSLELNMDLSAPVITASGGELDCSNTSVQLMSNADNPNASFRWSGPGGYSSNEQNPEVNQTGTYTIRVTNPNGCSTATAVEVTSDASLPNISVIGENLSCNMNSAVLIGSTSTTNATASWTGPNGFSSSQNEITVQEAGTYTYTVAGANGCSISESYEVINDNSAPEIIIEEGSIDCENQSISLVFSSPDALSSFTWSGPNGFSSSSFVIDAQEKGGYTLIVEGLNGCIEEKTYTFDVEFDYEYELVTEDASSSNKGSAQISINGGQGPFEFEWDNGQTGNEVTNLDPGIHFVIIKDDLGCERIVEFEIKMISSLIEEEQSAQIAVFPNPIINKATLSFNSVVAEHILILSELGQVLMRLPGNLENNTMTIDLENFENGRYYLVIQTSSGVIQKTIVKVQ